MYINITFFPRTRVSRRPVGEVVSVVVRPPDGRVVAGLVLPLVLAPALLRERIDRVRGGGQSKAGGYGMGGYGSTD